MTTADALSLFDDPQEPWKPEPSRMPLARRINRARTERDLAMHRVEEAAPPEWRDAAWAWLTGYLASHPTFFPDTDCVDAPQPPERRAWGPIIQRAARAGLIVDSGITSQRTLGHASVARVWASTVCG